MVEETLRARVARAAGSLGGHSYVKVTGIDELASSEVRLRLDLTVSLPNPWTADGQSPNGVRLIEPVGFLFGEAFPLRAPRPQLRDDFSRDHPHLNPTDPGEPPWPCIYDGDLDELHQQRGFAVLVERLEDWLSKAARGELINRDQGWERVRRDSVRSILVADADVLRDLAASPKGGYAFVELRLVPGPNVVAIAGDQLRSNVPILAQRIRAGGSFAVVIWPGRKGSGEPWTTDRYLPETVSNLEELEQRIKDYHVGEHWRTVRQMLRQVAGCGQMPDLIPIGVTILARRPDHLIGSESNLELCPYFVPLRSPSSFPAGGKTTVLPAGHWGVVSQALLRQMSGTGRAAPPGNWICLGAGSLGSKIATHLSRAGDGPSKIVDSDVFGPHNAARHALFPRPEVDGLKKAAALASALRTLGAETESLEEDVVTVLQDPVRAATVFPPDTWGIVNSTASFVVREALLRLSGDAPRVVETILFAEARVGLLSVEGPSKNPNSGDLISAAYSHFAANPRMRSVVFEAAKPLNRLVIGEGCGSATMVMSDATISAMAAPMATAISRLRTRGLPASVGQLQIGCLHEDGLSLSWVCHDVGPVVVVDVDDCTARVAELAARKIDATVDASAGVESGGILIGRYSDTSRTFYIVDVWEAPPDSRSTATEFVLGTEGLRKRLEVLDEQSESSLYCLGTWHSHLNESGPSATDRATADTLGRSRRTPHVMLIRTPSGYRGLLAQAL